MYCMVAQVKSERDAVCILAESVTTCTFGLCDFKVLRFVMVRCGFPFEKINSVLFSFAMMLHSTYTCACNCIFPGMFV